MEYIKEKDYDFIINKYHDSTKPFNPFRRFVRRDEIFVEENGLDGEKILEELVKRDEEIKDLPHPVRKAKAFAYVLENTKIVCDPRDKFPAINMIDRPLQKTITNQWGTGNYVPEVSERRIEFARRGIAKLLVDFDHITPYWDNVFKFGFTGLLKESERKRAERNCTQEEEAFFEGIKITYSAIIDFVGRLADLADVTEGSERMAKALRHIQSAPPETFYQTLLLSYLYFILMEHIEGIQARSLGNFDRLFCPYYLEDLEKGVTEEEIRTDLAYYLLQFTAIGNYWAQPVFLGGCKADESTEINELSYLFLDVYDRMGLYNPKIQIKLAESTPKDFVKRALDMIRRGKNSIVMVSDSAIRTSQMNAGATAEEARLCNVSGCFEHYIQGSVWTEMCYMNLLKPIEYALHRGCDGITGEFALRESPSLDAYDTFEKLYAEVKAQLATVVDESMEIVNAYEDYLAEVNPQAMMSAASPYCLERAKDALGGGGYKAGTGMMFGALADFADSLAMIRKYVYDRKEYTLQEFVKILDKNFEGEEVLRRKLFNDPDKYGNNKDLPDAIAVDIADFLAKHICGKPNAKKRNGAWNIGFHVARSIYEEADCTATSANGRLVGEELSKNCSASMGQNREGATAAILSVTKIDNSAFKGDAVLDLGLLPSAVKGEDGLEAMYGLLMTFVRRGGHAIQFNVFDGEMLRNAQKHPEKYEDLQIRVSGWNVLWNHMDKAEQDGYILQAESLI